MRYRDAKKLHNEDEIRIRILRGKHLKEPYHVRVVSVAVLTKDVLVLCDDGETYHHTAIE